LIELAPECTHTVEIQEREQLVSRSQELGVIVDKQGPDATGEHRGHAILHCHDTQMFLVFYGRRLMEGKGLRGCIYSPGFSAI
jgi:hypothetical protein